MPTIFIQIASYRDPELIPTIKDCLAKSKFPDRLTFGICHQYAAEDEWDNLSEFKYNPQFKIIEVRWQDSKGCCWARHHTQNLYNGETYTLQLDSHHRFAQDWDVELIDMLALTGVQKPILTAYAGMYSPKENRLLDSAPAKMVAYKFDDSGHVLVRPAYIHNYQDCAGPVPSRFFSGHFLFTLGQWCNECKYDPDLYFDGEEISLAVRSYTRGYDLFHPHKLLIWHEYTRDGRTKHWDDFNSEQIESKAVTDSWWSMDIKSRNKVSQILRSGTGDHGVYGLGNVRSLREYELYAGIDFTNGKMHKKTIDGEYPPTLTSREFDDWQKYEHVGFDGTIHDRSLTGPHKTSVYLLTFNAPQQIDYSLSKLWDNSPDWLEKPYKKFLIDNSTDGQSIIDNKIIAEKYGFEHISMGGNKGICGGRLFAAKHFQSSDSDYYFFFEDDMGLNPSTETGYCRNGFRKFVPDMWDSIHAIMCKRGFDFIKLSYTEVYMDNNVQVSWYNVPQSVRTAVWPHYDKLPETGFAENVPHTKIDKIEVHNGLSYAVGEIYYSNWPMIVSRPGNYKMFIQNEFSNPYEQHWMSAIFQESMKGNITSAVLLASPLVHNRISNYIHTDRREN